MVTSLILLDFSKAFDTVNRIIIYVESWRDILILIAPAISFIKNYLCDRNMVVFMSGATSSNIRMVAGVPQGSVLGPLLFSMLVNDLPNVLKYCKYHFFADDLQIYYTCVGLNIYISIQLI